MLCKRGLCRNAVSVRLSVTFVDSVEMNKGIFNFFTILVFFCTKRHDNIMTGIPPTLSNAGGVGNRNFSQYLAPLRAVNAKCNTLQL